MNVGGLEEVQSSDPAVMKSTSLGSLDGDCEHSQDLHVKVEDPEKHIEGYVSYYVLTKVSQSIMDHSPFELGIFITTAGKSIQNLVKWQSLGA